MLDLDMRLDTDLGIDSIKRVEIFSAIHDRLPEVSAGRARTTRSPGNAPGNRHLPGSTIVATESKGPTLDIPCSR